LRGVARVDFSCSITGGDQTAGLSGADDCGLSGANTIMRASVVLVCLTLLAGCVTLAASESVPEVHWDAASSRKLLRDRELRAVAPTLLAWVLRAPVSRRVRAGTVVKFSWSRAGGVGYGPSRCRFKKILAKSTRAGSILVKIPRGSLWWGDPYNCNRGQAALIVGF